MGCPLPVPKSLVHGGSMTSRNSEPPAGDSLRGGDERTADEKREDAATTIVGWKEIGRFFGRTESTVKRWEASRALPIRRVPGSAGATVYAYESELRAWLEGSPTAPSETRADGAGIVPANRPRAFAIAITAFAVIVGLAGAAYFTAGLWRAKDSAIAESKDPKATQLYKAALFEWQTRTPAGLVFAVKDFQGAIARDPNYAPAYAGLANCYNLLREFTPMPPEVAYPRAKAAAERAIALDPSIAEAHAALAFDDFYWSRDPRDARRQFLTAIALKPGSAEIHHWYATFLMTVREFPQAMREIDDAARLDPESMAILADKGLILINQGSKPEAIALLRRLEDTQPQFLSTHQYLAEVYLGSGNDSAYLKEVALAAKLRGDPRQRQIADAAQTGFTAGGHTAMLQSILAAEQQLYARRQQSAYQVALAYARLQNWDQAMAYLKLSVARHEPENIAMDVADALAPLRSRSDCRALLASAGLESSS
jgi:Tfp pilus assembly protein PilF